MQYKNGIIKVDSTRSEVDMGALYPAGAAPHRVGRVAVDGVGSDNEERGFR